MKYLFGRLNIAVIVTGVAGRWRVLEEQSASRGAADIRAQLAAILAAVDQLVASR